MTLSPILRNRREAKKKCIFIFFLLLLQTVWEIEAMRSNFVSLRDRLCVNTESVVVVAGLGFPLRFLFLPGPPEI